MTLFSIVELCNIRCHVSFHPMTLLSAPFHDTSGNRRAKESQYIHLNVTEGFKYITGYGSF
jgi:hypothetical protein